MRKVCLLSFCVATAVAVGAPAQSPLGLQAFTVPGCTEARVSGAAPAALVALALGTERAIVPLPGGAELGFVPFAVPVLGGADAAGFCTLFDRYPTTAGRGARFFAQGVVFDASPTSTPATALQVTPLRELCGPLFGERIDLVVLIGQSNAEGGAPEAELPDRLRGPLSQVRMWNAYAGEWQPLAAGVNNTLFPLAGRVGPEMGIADATAEAARPVWVVKLALFQATMGPSPGPWSEWGVHAGEIYPELLRRLDAAIAAARALALEPCVRQVCWMQGESDALDPALAAVYERHFGALVAQLRADLGARGVDGGNRVPVRIGLISPQLTLLGFPAVEVVRAAQRRVAASLPGCEAIDTAGLAVLPDGVHFTMASVLALGRRFAMPTDQ